MRRKVGLSHKPRSGETLAEGGRNIELIAEEENLSSRPHLMFSWSDERDSFLYPWHLFLFHCMGIWKLNNYHTPLLPILPLSVPFLSPFLIKDSVASSLVFFHNCVFIVVMVVLLFFSHQVMLNSLQPHGLQHAIPVPHHLPEFVHDHVH